MLNDEFGLRALLESVKSAEMDTNRAERVLDIDLSTLGVDMNYPDNLYPVFGGPWGETPERLDKTDYRIPPEYFMDEATRARLAPVRMDRYGNDVLFYIFYTYGGDARQIEAATELHKRGWKFHKDDGVWINLAIGGPTETSWTYAQGTYIFFNPLTWREDQKEFLLVYDRLEHEPPVASAAAPSASREPTGPAPENPE